VVMLCIGPHVLSFYLKTDIEPAHETVYIHDPVMESVQTKYSSDTTKQLHKSLSFLMTFNSHTVLDFIFVIPSHCRSGISSLSSFITLVS
jgi:hypothetical protein